MKRRNPRRRSAASLISRAQGGGDMNVTPSISPDGSRVVFLSEKSLFSIDMYVADVATGRITPQAGRDDERSAFRQPAVHRLGR